MQSDGADARGKARRDQQLCGSRVGTRGEQGTPRATEVPKSPPRAPWLAARSLEWLTPSHPGARDALHLGHVSNLRAVS